MRMVPEIPQAIRALIYLSRIVLIASLLIFSLNLVGNIADIADLQFSIDVKINLMLAVLGLSAGVLGEILFHQYNTISGLTDALKKNIIDLLQNLDKFVDPRLYLLTKDYLAISSRTISDIIEHKTFPVSNIEEFRSFYISVLNRNTGATFWATTIPTRKFFWSNPELNTAMKRFIERGGKITRIFFIHGGVDSVPPSSIAVIQEQADMGIECYIRAPLKTPDIWL